MNFFNEKKERERERGNGDLVTLVAEVPYAFVLDIISFMSLHLILELLAELSLTLSASICFQDFISRGGRKFPLYR